jgi:hypothetical protein
MKFSPNTNGFEFSFEELYSLHQDGKIFHDIQFNRIQAGAWDSNRKKEYIQSVYDSDIHSLIVLVDVEACLIHAKNIQDTSSIEYFTKCQKNGYKYVILDGSNRIGSIEQYLTNKFKIIKNKTEFDSSRIQFKSKYLLVSMVTSASKSKLHKLAIDLNSGVTWNPQEKRNAHDKAISRLIREISLSGYKKSVDNKIDGIAAARMKEQELLALCFNFIMNGSFGGQTQLNKLYNLEDSEISNETIKLFKKICEIMFSMFGEKTNMKFRKTLFCYLFATLSELEKDGYTIKEKEYMNFFNGFADKFEQLYSDETTQYWSVDRNQDYIWKNLMSFIDIEGEQKLSVLLGFVFSKLNTTLKPTTSKRTIKTGTKHKVRFDIANRDKCQVRINGCINGVWFNTEDTKNEYQEFKFHEVVLSSNIHVDHIKSLDKDGLDEIENMELATAEYNLWKSNKI